jgi:hypothetical protein
VLWLWFLPISQYSKKSLIAFFSGDGGMGVFVIGKFFKVEQYVMLANIKHDTLYKTILL